MIRAATRYWTALGIFTLAVVTATGQPETPKAKYKVVAFADIAKKDDVNKSEPAGPLKEGLNRLGKDGWEAIAAGERGIVFRKSSSYQSWEYRLVKTPESTLNGKSEDDEVLQLVLEGLSAQGWELCLVQMEKSSSMVFKRQVALEEKTKKAAAPPVELPLPLLPSNKADGALTFPPLLPLPEPPKKK